MRRNRERDPKWTGKPLYILVDGGVASAAEAVAYGAQQEKTGIIVAEFEPTARPTTTEIPIAPVFVLSVSITVRSILSAGMTGKEPV